MHKNNNNMIPPKFTLNHHGNSCVFIGRLCRRSVLVLEIIHSPSAAFQRVYTPPFLLLPVFTTACFKLSAPFTVVTILPAGEEAAMLKAIQVSAPVEQQVATAEMETEASPSGPIGAAVMEYDLQAPVNADAQQLQQQQQQQQYQEGAEEPAEMEEFKLFRDYFGLINLVKSFANVPDDLVSPSSDYSLEQELRERRDSLGSAGSEFSSSNSMESVEVADIYYTAYGHGNDGILGMKQAFMDPREDSLKVATSASGLPTSLLLEHKIMASAAMAKKPQVCKNKGAGHLAKNLKVYYTISAVLSLLLLFILLLFYLNRFASFAETTERARVFTRPII